MVKNGDMLLPGWSAWADCSVPEAASFPAPRWRYSLLSAAGWPPGREKNKTKSWTLEQSLDMWHSCKSKNRHKLTIFPALCICAESLCIPPAPAFGSLNNTVCAHMCVCVCQCVHVWDTLLSFSPSVCGRSVFRDWNPALMLCIRRRSLLLAISLRIRLSWSWAVSGLRGMLARLKERGQRKKMIMTVSWSHRESVSSPLKHNQVYD